jgi:hypothetical protein
VWEWFVEGYRAGNSHMTYRVERLPWSRYRPELFSGALVIFWLVVAEAARRVRSATAQGVPATHPM